MRRLVSITTAVAFLVAFGIASASYAQAAAQGRQGGGAARGGGGGGGRRAGRCARAVTAALVVDMQLKMPPSQTGQSKVVQDNLVDPNLELKQYGLHESCQHDVGNSGQRDQRPYSLWSGECEQPFATNVPAQGELDGSHRHSKDPLDRQDVRFPHVVRPIVKLLDGTMYAGDFASESVPLLLTSEFVPASIPLESSSIRSGSSRSARRAASSITSGRLRISQG
jgi:hypothetical protein